MLGVDGRDAQQEIGESAGQRRVETADKVLFARSMDALSQPFDVARMTLQTLINTYPIPSCRRGQAGRVADSWYAEGWFERVATGRNRIQGFPHFFPNMPEQPRRSWKVAKSTIRKWKSDRDYTHAMRAERNTGADSGVSRQQLVPQAKQRLREVQEVLAEREFGIGRFYYLRMVVSGRLRA